MAEKQPTAMKILGYGGALLWVGDVVAAHYWSGPIRNYVHLTAVVMTGFMLIVFLILRRSTRQ